MAETWEEKSLFYSASEGGYWCGKATLATACEWLAD